MKIKKAVDELWKSTNLMMLVKSSQDLMSLAKSTGEKSGHKYLGRKPKPGGGWTYTYEFQYDDGAGGKHEVEDDEHGNVHKIEGKHIGEHKAKMEEHETRATRIGMEPGRRKEAEAEREKGRKHREAVGILEHHMDRKKKEKDRDWDTEERKMKYTVGVLKNNVFYDYEIDYYSGKEGKKPHGIDDDVWAKAFLKAGSIMVRSSSKNAKPDVWRLNTKTGERTDITTGKVID